MAVLKLPIPFLTVVVLSVALAIFFVAWAASSRVEARSENAALAQARPGYAAGREAEDLVTPDASEAPKEWWEKSSLFVCPLH